jgi:hypothetical protein
MKYIVTASSAVRAKESGNYAFRVDHSIGDDKYH